MNYRYQIVIKSWQQNQYGPGWFKDAYNTELKFSDDENMKQFIECYGNADSLVVFLEELLNVAYPRQSQEQATSLDSLNYEELRQKVNQLLKSQEVLELAKQELEKEVSTLSRTKENREVEKLKKEKAELQRQMDQLNRDNRDFESQITRLERNLERVQQQLSNQQTTSNQDYQQYQTLLRQNTELKRKLASEEQLKNQYYANSNEYDKLTRAWGQLFPQFRSLNELASHINLLAAEKDKWQKSKQASDQKLQEVEQELQETQQKLSVATKRLRYINIHSDHAGGDSRSDQLKNEFSHLKTGLFHEVSTNVLKSWQSQGFKSTARNDFKSEEFFKIKSILSQRVFGDGMAYFAKAVDAELHLVMDALEGITGFSPTPAIFQEIQEKIQVGLLRAKGVDHSDEAIEKFIEETTQRIDQELKLIANLETTGEALSEIKKFVEAGLKIAREIVNDANSGELFIPENGSHFDDKAHETRDDHQGQIKMTICAGYRIKGTVLVKADVMTYEPEATPPNSEQEPVNPQIPNPQNLQLEGEVRENGSPKLQKLEDEKQATDSIIGQGESVFGQPQPSDSSQHSDGKHENPDPNESEKSSAIFSGKVTSRGGLCLRSRPNNQYRTKITKPLNAVLAFEAWIVGEVWDDISKNQANKRWYKLAGQEYWVPSEFIEGEPPSDMPPMEYSGGDDEAQ